MRTRIGLLPSLMTLGNLVCGFAAIAVAVKAHVQWVQLKGSMGAQPDPWRSFALAGALILLAMVFDALDGKIARMANLTSEFGAQLDSLADMVTFGIAPAYIVFLESASRGLLGNTKFTWLGPLLYAACTALRLARFNVETGPDEESHRFFRGLPCPAAAGVIASLAIFDWKTGEAVFWAAWAMPFAAVVLAGLMISRIRYVHLLNLFFRERKPFLYLAVVFLGICVILALPEDYEHYEYLLLAGFGGYVLSGPISLGWSFAHRRRQGGARAAPAAGHGRRAGPDDVSAPNSPAS